MFKQVVDYFFKRVAPVPVATPQTLKFAAPQYYDYLPLKPTEFY